jgi:4-amino-4-deoxy-L-arabinose transferase-like glycosyltransferase
MQASNSRQIFFIISIVLLLVISLWVRVLYIDKNYNHPDEMIVVAVVHEMYDNGNFDINWKYASLPQYFKYDQYNFSSYHYTAFGFYSVSRFIVERLAGIAWQESYELYTFRLLSVIFAVATSLLLVLIALRRFHSRRLAGLVLLLYSVATILIQDAHYARCDTFLTFFSVFLFYLGSNENVYKIRWFWIGFITGILIACKFSMTFILLIPLLAIAGLASSGQPASLRIYIGPLFLLCGGIVAGAVIGMPYAFIHPIDYLAGISYLQNQ